VRVAIICDWLVGGGAEKVVLQLHKMFPEAPIYTSYSTDEWRSNLDNKVVTGYLQKFSKLRKFIPFLRMWWFSHLDLSEYDLVISSSGAEAKFIRSKSGARHVAYIHAPTHYYWSRYEQYLKEPGFGSFDWLARLGLRLLIWPLRWLDYRAAQRPNYLIANSNFTKDEIKKYYDRNSKVIYPPVDVEKFSKIQPAKIRKGFIVVGRQTPYKRIDLAVEACTSLSEDLTVIGNGPDHERLVSMAGSSVNFAPFATDLEVAEQLSRAKAFIFPGVDDFGISPVEAMSAGIPIIAYKGGGALDYVVPSLSGQFFDQQTSASLAKAINDFDEAKFNTAKIKNLAQKFSTGRFKQELENFIKSVSS
jgi:glycosyltransferase involved in cell wall biosynthesis